MRHARTLGTPAHSPTTTARARRLAASASLLLASVALTGLTGCDSQAHDAHLGAMQHAGKKRTDTSFQFEIADDTPGDSIAGKRRWIIVDDPRPGGNPRPGGTSPLDEGDGGRKRTDTSFDFRTSDGNAGPPDESDAGKKRDDTNFNFQIADGPTAPGHRKRTDTPFGFRPGDASGTPSAPLNEARKRRHDTAFGF